jgi:hypothetical protein
MCGATVSKVRNENLSTLWFNIYVYIKRPNKKKYTWGVQNSSKMWEFRSCKFIREGVRDKKEYCNIKPGRFNFYDRRNFAYLQAFFLHHGRTTISLLPYMDVTVLSRVAKTVRGKKFHLSLSLSLSLCFYVHTDSCNSSDLDRQNKR